MINYFKEIKIINKLEESEKKKLLKKINFKLKNIFFKKRSNLILTNLPYNFMLSSSFGIQSMILINIIIKSKPKIPISLLDTGYLFNETYKFININNNKKKLNLKVIRNKKTQIWQKIEYGKLWKISKLGIKKYNKINKINPINKIIKKAKINTWLNGIRYKQSNNRNKILIFNIKKGIFKISILSDYNINNLYNYIKIKNIIFHPLWFKGYKSIGDFYTSNRLNKKMLEKNTRFFGINRECGLHNK